MESNKRVRNIIYYSDSNDSDNVLLNEKTEPCKGFGFKLFFQLIF